MSINPDEGYFLVDKPLNWTSFQVVNKIKYLFKHRLKKKIKIGHAGTLDPLASGLLIVCYGKMTKQISTFQDLHKEYTGVIRLGSTTPSFDLETEVDQEFDTSHLTESLIVNAAQEMVGPNEQIPPLYSAKKIDGERAYHLARKGVKKELKKNLVQINAFDVSSETLLDVSFRIECSKGTYIRSIARDLGEKLNCGGHLTELRRTAIGQYKVESACTIDQIVKEFEKEDS